MKAFRFVFFTIFIPIICALFFALDGFCANAIPTSSPNDFFEQYPRYTDYYRSSGQGTVYGVFISGKMYFICSIDDRSTASVTNDSWWGMDFNGSTNFVGADGQTYCYVDLYAGRGTTMGDGWERLNSIYEFRTASKPPTSLHRLPEDNSNRFKVNTLKDFKYSLLDTQPWDDLITRWLQAHNIISADFMEYTSGIFHFTWGNTIDMHLDGGSIINDVPLSGVQVQGGIMNLYNGNILKNLTYKTYEDGFFNSYQPDFAGIESYIYSILENFANYHPVLLFTPVVEYEGNKYFGETLVFDMAIKKISSDSPWFNNDTSVTGSDGNVYNVDFGSGSSSSYSYQGGEWDSDVDVDLGDSLTNYNNYITNNHGLSADEILYILTHDPRFQSGPTEIIITPQFDPNGISDDDDLWLGKLRDLYQMILGFNPLIGRITSAFSSYFIFLPDWVISFMFTVGSIGLLLGVVKVIRG